MDHKEWKKCVLTDKETTKEIRDYLYPYLVDYNDMQIKLIVEEVCLRVFRAIDRVDKR